MTPPPPPEQVSIYNIIISILKQQLLIQNVSTPKSIKNNKFWKKNFGELTPYKKCIYSYNYFLML